MAARRLNVIARVVLIIVCGFAIGYFMWSEHVFSFGPPPQSSASTTNATPTVQPAPPAVKPKPASKPKPDSQGASASSASGAGALGAAASVVAVDSVPAHEAAVATAPAPAVDPPPFPQIQQIAAGEDEDVVREKYGNPAISALTSRGGHIERTYVYTRDRGYSETVIHLEDGRVAGAYSKSAPPTPTGISIPRVGHPEAN